jgi:hypothetical protein
MDYRLLLQLAALGFYRGMHEFLVALVGMVGCS